MGGKIRKKRKALELLKGVICAETIYLDTKV
jgi:hypothetical protein